MSSCACLVHALLLSPVSAPLTAFARFSACCMLEHKGWSWTLTSSCSPPAQASSVALALSLSFLASKTAA